MVNSTEYCPVELQTITLADDPSLYNLSMFPKKALFRHNQRSCNIWTIYISSVYINTA
ncbi:hypothetical protein CLU79DRAFT_743122, partial [Phycomyces nitens]